MSIRHSFIASSLILAPIATLGFSSAAFANDTVNIPISGTVLPTMELNATVASEAATLPLSTEGQQFIKIADLVVTTNTSSASLTAASTSNSTLRNTSDLWAMPLDYQIGIIPPGGPVENITFSPVTDFQRWVGGGPFDFYIRYTITPQTPLRAGTYSDTITLTIAAD